jgi:autotransporter-associated beta strand protein
LSPDRITHDREYFLFPPDERLTAMSILNWLKQISEPTLRCHSLRNRKRHVFHHSTTAMAISHESQVLEKRVVLASNPIIELSGNVLIIQGGLEINSSFFFSRFDETTLQLQDQNDNQIDVGFSAELIATDIGDSTVLITVGSFTSVQFNCNDGTDSVALDFSGEAFVVPIGAPDPVPTALPISVNGGTGTDTLVLTGGSTTSVAHLATNDTSGSFTLTDLVGTVSYSGLEAADDVLAATNRSFTFSGSADVASVTIDVAGRTKIDSGFAVPVSFVSPSSSLLISLGDGGDSLTVSSVDPSLTAALTVTGDAGSDTVNLNTTLNLGSLNSTGNVNVSAETINVREEIDTTAGTLGSVTLNASGTLTTFADGDIEADGTVALTGSTISFGGDVVTTGASVTLTGNVSQRAIALIQTNNGNVTIQNSFDDNGLTSDQDLTINAGVGNVQFSNAVGSTQALRSLTITAGTFSATSIATATSLTITNSAAGSVSGIISGTGTLTKSGNGTLTLDGNNSYGGTTSVNGGTLLVNGTQTTSSSTVTVGGTATLGGSGTVGRPVTVPGTGALAPGTSPETLSVGDLSLAADSVLNIELNGTTVETEYDQLIVNGTVSLGDATLNLTLGYVPNNGHSFTIISNDGTDAVSGTLKVSGVPIPDGSDFILGGNRYVVDYTSGTDNNDVTLTVSNNAAPTAVVLTPTSVNLSEAADTSSAIILSDISITDDAFGTNTLSLSGTHAGLFEIVAGQLRLKAGTSLNFEINPSYQVTVQVDDESVGSTPDATAVFTLNITNANEQPTDISLSANTILENLSSGNTIGTLSTTDPEGGSFNYELVEGEGDDDNASFDIDESNLVSNAVFDFETKNSYSVRVRSTDSGGLTVEKEFTITVVNQTEVTGINIGQGLSQRSFVRYLDIVFDRSDDLLDLVNDNLSTRLRVTRKGLNGSDSIPVALPAITSGNIIGSAIRIDFGANGITGSRTTNVGDGYYQIEVDADDDSVGTFESSNHFHRLLGDVTGNGSVNSADKSQLLAGTGGVSENDVNGDGVVNISDTLLLSRAVNRTLNGSLTLND